jgi:hypothetical protein
MHSGKGNVKLLALVVELDLVLLTLIDYLLIFTVTGVLTQLVVVIGFNKTLEVLI